MTYHAGRHYDLNMIDHMPLIRSLGEAFAALGEELYLVGGAVRDELLGIATPFQELDFATSALPEVTVKALQGLGVGRPYRVGEKFGTIGLRAGRRTLEVTTFRSEVYTPGSRKPEVRFGASLEEDLCRRDFTINAIAQDPLSGEIVDPLGGRHDLERRLVRAVRTPEDRFREDPLRLLRAVRFAARLGFDIEPATWNAVQRCAALLRSISRERVRDEYSRILLGPEPPRGLTLLLEGNLLEYSVPQLLDLARMPDHGPRHPLSLWDHTMRAVALVPPDLGLRWAALLHDIGKPATRTHEPTGRPRFFHHEELGAEIARQVLTGLRYPNQLVDEVTLLVETHMQLHSYSSEWSNGAVRRLMLRLGPFLPDAVSLARADAAGHVLDRAPASSSKFDQLEERIAALGREETATLKSPLSGDDLMAHFGRPPGPWIRVIKNALLDAVLEGSLAPDDRETAWRIVDSITTE